MRETNKSIEGPLEIARAKRDEMKNKLKQFPKHKMSH